MTVSSDKLGTIRKLMAKAQGTTNPHEAAIFMAKAQAMMEAEGVDMMAVDLHGIGEADVKSRFSVSKINPAENVVMHAVADAFGCKLLWKKRRSSIVVDEIRYKIKGDNFARHVLVGSKDRLGLASYAAEVLIRQLAKARTEFVKTRSEEYWGYALEDVELDDEGDVRAHPGIRAAIRKQVTKDADSFALGWAWEIQKRVIKFALNDKEQLLLVEYTKNIEGKADTKDFELNASYHDGVEAAKKADLHRPIDESGIRAPLLGETRRLGS